MNIEEIQNLDVEEAKIIISLKNDEISKLKATLKTIEIKNNLRQADFRHKIDYFDHKCKAAETKFQKAEEIYRKEKASLEEEIKWSQREIEKGKDLSQKLQSHSHQKERELNCSIFEEKLRAEREKQHSSKLSAQLSLLLKYFDPKKALAALEKQHLDEIPTYLELYDRWKSTSQSLENANRHMASIKADIMSEMENSFQKMNSFENVMEDLRAKNEELRLSVEQKEHQLRENSREISSKEDLIETIREQADFHLEHLNYEIVSLKQEVASYQLSQKRETEGGSQSLCLRQIDDLVRKLAEKQFELDQISSEFEEKISQLEHQNKVLKETIEQIRAQQASKAEQYERCLNEYKQEREDQQQIISLLNVTLKDYEQVNAELNKELAKRIAEISQLLLKKKRMEEQLRLNEENFKSSLRSCHEDLQYLRKKLGMRSGDASESRSRKFSISHKSMTSNEEQDSKKLTRVMSGGFSIKEYTQSKNLLIDLVEEMDPDDPGPKGNTDIGYYEHSESWSEKYHNLLLKHNHFIKLVFARLKGLPFHQGEVFCVK